MIRAETTLFTTASGAAERTVSTKEPRACEVLASPSSELHAELRIRFFGKLNRILPPRNIYERSWVSHLRAATVCRVFPRNAESLEKRSH